MTAPRNCSVAGCDRPTAARTWCHPHWKRWRKYGDPAAPTPPRRCAPAEVRFWSKVDKDGPTPEHRPDLGPCWVWTRSVDDCGYGYFRVVNGDTMKRAHRVSWEFANGPVPDGLLVLHRCDNPPCVNPAHLFLGDDADNNADKVAKNRQARGTPAHFGQASPGAVLSDVQVREIRESYFAGGRLQRELADEYGIAQATVSSIVRGASRRDTFDGDRRRARNGRAPKRALTSEQAEAVKRRRRSGEVLRTIAVDYGVSLSLISRTARTR